MEREPAPVHGYTYGQPSSNRGVDGTGGLPGSNPVDVRLGGVPVWVVGVPLGDGTAWVVSLEDGRVRAFRLEGSGEISPQPIVPQPIVPERLPPGAPPLVEAKDGELELVVADDRELSALTHPGPASAGGNLLGITRGGGVLAGGERIPGVVALPDARLARSADGAVAALSKPTARYEHGVLGDGLEAEAMTLLRPADEGYRVSGRIRPASGGVFETVAPLWSKLNGDDLLAVTESTAAEGSRVSVYDPDGSLVAAGPFIGAPQKWRHVLAAGPFGPGGETEIAVTRTPHFGPRIEFYEPNLDEGELRLAAARPGYTSHRIYTRNLDAARAGDFDGDGRWELLVPDESYTGLGAIRHEEDGARVAWTLPIGGTLVTNLASATNWEGRAQVAAGRSDGVLRIWP